MKIGVHHIHDAQKEFILLLEKGVLMMKKIVENILSRVEKALEGIGNFINQTPTPEENKKTLRSPGAVPPFETKREKDFPRKSEKFKSKEIYEHKGSGYKGKGKINTDTSTFNQPRKGISPGRKH